MAGGSDGGGDGDLAETGSSLPLVALGLGAVALLGTGAYLVMRRRISSTV